MAEGGENPGKDDKDSISGRKTKRQNAETDDEEDHGTQKELVEAIQCTEGGQEECSVNEDPPTLTTGGTLPFAAAGTNDVDQQRRKNTIMKTLIRKAKELDACVQKDGKVTPVIKELASSIKMLAEEIGNLLNPGMREKVERLSRTVECMDFP